MQGGEAGGGGDDKRGLVKVPYSGELRSILRVCLEAQSPCSTAVRSA